MADLLTIPEASSMLRLRPSTLRAWILRRRIPYVKLSRRVFLRKADVEALISSSIIPAKGR
jgi:excisionase family DNA binding protein